MSDQITAEHIRDFLRAIQRQTEVSPVSPIVSLFGGLGIGEIVNLLKEIVEARLYNGTKSNTSPPPADIRKKSEISSEEKVEIAANFPPGRKVQVYRSWASLYYCYFWKKVSDKAIALAAYRDLEDPARHLRGDREKGYTYLAQAINHKLRILQTQEDQASLEDILRMHVETVIARYGKWVEQYTDLAMLSDETELNDVLQDWIQPRYIVTQDAPDRIKQISTFDDLVDHLELHQRLAIIGAPGSGKTVTLQRLAYEFAAKYLEGTTAPIPIIILLGKYQNGKFRDFLQRELGDALFDYYNHNPEGFIILLDGLNEIASRKSNYIRDWISDNTKLRLAVTCRTFDYTHLSVSVRRVDIQPLDVERIYSFLAKILPDGDAFFWGLAGSDVLDSWKWYQTQTRGAKFYDFWYGDVGTANTWDVEKFNLKSLQGKLRQTGELPNLLGLAQSPLLLKMLIIRYKELGTVPHNRALLFDYFLHHLMEKSKDIALDNETRWVDNSSQRKVLRELAYRWQARTLGKFASTSWVKKQIRSLLPSEDDENLLYLMISAGLIERDGEQCRFVHDLFREYLAAYEMEKDLPDPNAVHKYWSSDQWWFPTGWEETAIFMAGLEDDCSDVVEWLLPANPDLAWRCVNESGVNCSRETLQKLFVPPPSIQTTPKARAEWGRRLALHGDRRPGVALRPGGLPDIVWCCVPAGEYQIGNDPHVFFDYLELPAKNLKAKLEIPYFYWMAKYVVTFSQFEPFVSDTGIYPNKEFWDSDYWHIANHPVIGVNWYLALQYSQWLNNWKQMLIPSDFPQGVDLSDYNIRLPTEFEWEAAARYPDARIYPWGSEYRSRNANIDENDQTAQVAPYYLRRTTAVGIYTGGVHPLNGLADLAGNVWEWTANLWSREYLNLLPSNASGEDNRPRIVRGGSWFTCARLARSTCRRGCPPDFDQTPIFGFRLVFAPKNDAHPYLVSVR